MSDYGAISVTWHAPTVDVAPERALMSASLLSGFYTGAGAPWWPEPDVVYVGHIHGEPVYYRVTGWDPDHKALILERTTR